MESLGLWLGSGFKRVELPKKKQLAFGLIMSVSVTPLPSVTTEQVFQLANQQNDLKPSFTEKSLSQSTNEVSLNPDTILDTMSLPTNLKPDPRFKDGINVDAKKAQRQKIGRNTESFDPKSTLVRPSMRIIVGNNGSVFNKLPLKHDDVVIVPNFFGEEDDWSLYYKLIQEMADAQEHSDKDTSNKNSDWISWHEGSHLISKNPKPSKTYQEIQDKIAQYFCIEQKSVGTRFNWYRDSRDWKPFHHDSAAFNPQRARNQNITVGVSFGSSRELAFLHATTGERIYFPQTNNMLFSFGRDVNINYKHGINAIEEGSSQDNDRGRVSIILWGQVPDHIVKEEANSPRMLTDNTRGNGHSMHSKQRHDRKRGHENRHEDHNDRDRAYRRREHNDDGRRRENNRHENHYGNRDNRKDDRDRRREDDYGRHREYDNRSDRFSGIHDNRSDRFSGIH
jgi:hypothetical protein